MENIAFINFRGSFHEKKAFSPIRVRCPTNKERFHRHALKPHKSKFAKPRVIRWNNAFARPAGGLGLR